jgi:LytS/YehU family sensor histidine kinase
MRRASNAPRMLEVISFIPTLCVIGLVVFGLAGFEPTAPIILWAVAGAIMGGPVVVTLVGFVGWLLMVVAGTVVATAYAANRHRPIRG